MEVASKDAAEMRNSDVHYSGASDKKHTSRDDKSHRKKRSVAERCYRCHKSGHYPMNCQFK